jgi:hypothetical protein
MTCDAIQNRLLALPDVRRVPDELRGHLDGCPACRAYLARAVRLDKLLATIPVPPPSEETKAAFLDRATEAGPVIKHIPVVRRDSGTYLLDDGRWKYTAAALAAAVLVAVGWLAFRGGDAPPSRNDYTTVAGHELLTKTLGNVVTGEKALAKVDKPEQRMKAWENVTADLRAEIERVYRFTPKDRDDLNALAGLFKKAAEDGLLRQADAVMNGQLPADQRQALLRDAIGQMDRIEADATTFAQEAPEHNKLPLRKIRDTAKKVREGLSDKLEPRQAGGVPAKGV